MGNALCRKILETSQRLYPAGFRQQFGEEIASVFEDSLAAAGTSKLRKLSTGFWLLADLLHSSAAERIADFRAQLGFATDARIATFWIPAVISISSSMGLLMLLRDIGVEPRVIFIGPTAMTIYLPWLLLLPFCGALCRMRDKAHFIPILLPSFVFLFMGLVILLARRSVWANNPEAALIAFAVFAFNWAILPALAMLMGTLPFRYQTKGCSSLPE